MSDDGPVSFRREITLTVDEALTIAGTCIDAAIVAEDAELLGLVEQLEAANELLLDRLLGQ